MWLWLFQLFSCCLVLFILFQLVHLILSDCDLVLSLYARRGGRNLDTLRGKVVWVTGASSGIGEELAYSLAMLGARLVLSSRRRTELERVIEKCKALSPAEFKNDHMILCLDLVDCDSHAALTEQVIQRYGKVDYLVNNAGRGTLAPAVDTQLAVDRAILELNTIGTISLTKTLLPHMLQQSSGTIVVISSIAGKIGSPGSAAYTASKHALQGYFNALRMEIADRGVKVVMVCPGPVVSNINKTTFSTDIGKEPLKEPFKELSKFIAPSFMPTKRCAYLTAVAMANNLSEVWISPQPVLLVTYLAQYVPIVTAWVGNFVGSKRIKELMEYNAKTNKSD